MWCQLRLFVKITHQYRYVVISNTHSKEIPLTGRDAQFWLNSQLLNTYDIHPEISRNKLAKIANDRKSGLRQAHIAPAAPFCIGLGGVGPIRSGAGGVRDGACPKNE